MYRAPTDPAVAAPSTTPAHQAADARTRRLVEAPIVPLLIRLAWPNVLIMLAQASAGLIETFFVAKLGTAALAAMALVFPAVMLMTTLSAGALGGAISSAVARALGAGRQAAADALVLHAIAVSLAFGFAFAALFLLFGRQIYGAMGGSGPELEAALIYSNIVFLGTPLTWTMNGLASVVRGTGNMLLPAIVICVGVVLLIPVSPLLIFGFGPIPGFGIAGGGLALIAYYLGGTLVLGAYILSGRNPARFRWVRLDWRVIGSVMRVGALSSLQSIQTNVIVGGATALVALQGGVDAVAGFGTGVRLEYLLIPLIFGIGAPMVAMVGTNLGAGRGDRALHIALAGAGLAFFVTETVGLAAAVFPEAWLYLFSAEPAMVATGSAYLRIVGPFYGFFGIGLALYFAAQGAGRLFWPVVAGFLRVAIALGGGFMALWLTGSIAALFAALSLALVVYAVTTLAAVKTGAWLR